MHSGRSYRFSHTISRFPGNSVCNGLRAGDGSDPLAENFILEHQGYLDALRRAGVKTTVLPKLEQFPDSVFVEDVALCFDGVVLLLRPGAPSRFKEAEAIVPDLDRMFGGVIRLPGQGTVDGGDILLTDTEALIGISDRTSLAGVEALTPILEAHGYGVRVVTTPEGVLHFKSDCGLLDSETIFATRVLAASGCLQGYRVIEAPAGEEAAANLIRVNDHVIIRTGFPLTHALLEKSGYRTITVDGDEAVKIDGGLSCMSLRFSLDDH